MGFDKYSKETSLEEMGETQEVTETPVEETVVTEPAPEATEPIVPVEPEAEVAPETEVKKEGE
ncbi:MAG: hypothetical protein WC333_00375 [Dehalococcoidia bacterium]|jgi:hypothetical protein